MNWNPNELYKNRDVATQYDASRFSSLPGRAFNRWEQNVIEKCFRPVPKGTLVVDIPCGTGRLAERLLSVGYKVHGIDISDEMLAVARHRLARFGDDFTCEVADARDMRPGTARCSAALCARVLMHFPLAEQVSFLAGVVKLGGSTVVINHSFSSPYQRLRRKIKRLLGNQPPAGHPVTNQEIKELLRGAGLREVRRYRLWSLLSEAVYIVAARI